MTRYKKCCKLWLEFNKEYADCESIFDIAYLGTKAYYNGKMSPVNYCPICGRKLI